MTKIILFDEIVESEFSEYYFNEIFVTKDRVKKWFDLIKVLYVLCLAQCSH